MRKRKLLARALAAAAGALALSAVPAGAAVYEGEGAGVLPDPGVCDYPAYPLYVTFDVDLDEEVEDVRVRLRYQGPAIAEDMVAALRAPGAVAETNLFYRPRRSQGRFHASLLGPYLFTDDAEVTFWQAVDSGNPLPGAYRTVPSETHWQPTPTIDPAPTSLNEPFEGLDAQGTWTLLLYDACTGDTSVLAEAQLAINENGPQPEPKILSVDGPSGLTNDPRPTFTWESEDADRFVCSIDDGAEPHWRGCDSSSSHGADDPLPDGEYTFRVYGQQPWGLDHTPVVTRQFEVDATAPTVKIRGVKVKKRKRAARVRFNAQDAGKPAAELRVRCRVDAKPWRNCRSPFVAKRLRPGRHKVTVEATDAAGNKTKAEKRFRVPKVKKKGARKRR